MASRRFFRQGAGSARRVLFVGTQGGAVDLATADPAHLCALAASAFCVVKPAKGDPQRADDFPQQWARMWLDGEEPDALPELRGIAHAPVLRQDGMLASGEGFDPASGYWLACDLDLPPMPDVPTKADAEAALDKLASLLRSYQFASERDYIAAIGFVVTAVLRPSFDIAPMIVVDAAYARSGKGHLLRTVSLVGCGRAPVIIGMGGGPEERGKRVPAALLRGEPLVVLDNINGPFNADDLCSYLSEGGADVRAYAEIGGLRRALNGNVIAATGNNIRLAGDLAARGVVSRLDADTDTPGLRSFSFQPHPEAQENRALYIAAAITLARWGRSLPPPPEGSNGFEKWACAVRWPLLRLTGQDIMSSTFDRQAEEAADTGEAEEVDALGDLLGERVFTAADLMALPARDTLPGRWPGIGDAKNAGYRLRHLKGRIGTRWKLESVVKPQGGSNVSHYRMVTRGPDWLR